MCSQGDPGNKDIEEADTRGRVWLRYSPLLLGLGFVAGPVEGFAFDVAVVGDVVEADADSFADAAFLHGDAVEGGGGSHCFFAVCDDDEFRPAEEFLEDVDEAADVGFVEGGVHFVQHAERARAELEDGQQQGDGGEGLFAAGEKRVVERRLAGGVAMISTPASRTSTPSSSTMSALPPPKALR